MLVRASNIDPEFSFKDARHLKKREDVIDGYGSYPGHKDETPRGRYSTTGARFEREIYRLARRTSAHSSEPIWNTIIKEDCALPDIEDSNSPYYSIGLDVT